MRAKVKVADGDSRNKDLGVLAEKTADEALREIQEAGGKVLDLQINVDPSAKGFGAVIVTVLYDGGTVSNETAIVKKRGRRKV